MDTPIYEKNDVSRSGKDVKKMPQLRKWTRLLLLLLLAALLLNTVSTPSRAANARDGMAQLDKKPKPEPTPRPTPGPRDGGADD